MEMMNAFSSLDLSPATKNRGAVTVRCTTRWLATAFRTADIKSAARRTTALIAKCL